MNLLTRLTGCPRCHAAPGQSCTLAPATLAARPELDGRDAFHSARIALADYAHTLARLDGTDGAIVVGVAAAQDDAPAGAVTLWAYRHRDGARGVFLWHVGAGTVTDTATGETVGGCAFTRTAREAVRAAMLARPELGPELGPESALPPELTLVTRGNPRGVWAVARDRAGWAVVTVYAQQDGTYAGTLTGGRWTTAGSVRHVLAACLHLAGTLDRGALDR